MADPDDLPPRFRKAMAEPATARYPWWSTPASALIATYLWIAYADRIAQPSLAIGGLGAAILGAVLGGLLGAALLFVPAGLLGVRSRRPLMVVAAGAFGARGAALVPGVLIGLVQIVWFAVAVHYAVAFNLRGLSAFGLIDERSVRPADGSGMIYESPVYGVTGLMWGVAAALVATRFIRWIAALMIVFPLFSAMALGGAAAWAIPGLPRFATPRFDYLTNETVEPGAAAAVAVIAMLQYVFGFTASVAAQAVNWGASSRDRRDVLIGGAVGTGLAPAILATIAVLAVAGYQGRMPAAGGTDEATTAAPRIEDYTIGAVFEDGIGGIAGGTGLIVLGLASMASAVYAAYAYSNRLEAIRSRPRRWAWGVIGAFVAFPLMRTGLAANVPLIVDLTAGVVAPTLGVMTLELLRHRRSWPGPRGGLVAGGLAAWAIGAVVGLLPVVERIGGDPGLVRWFPASLVAFAVAMLAAATLDRGDGRRFAPPPS